MSRTRLGGRSAAVRAKVLAAASDLVAVKGPQAVTIPEIAQRAGIAATSLYRRLGDVGSLLLDMAVERLANELPLPDKGTIKQDLRCWGERIAVGLSSSNESNFFRILLVTWNITPENRISALGPRLEEIQAMLQRGKIRGETAPSADDVINHLLAPLYLRALLGLPVDKQLVNALVDRLLAN